MSGLGFERATQKRVIKLFDEKLHYRYLGDWKDRSDNSNMEEDILISVLQRRGYSASEISGALYQLRGAADVSQAGLYEANRRVYSLLRYGVQVKAAADQPTTTVSLIDWHNPEANDFAIAEEVTLKGAQERRPDLVLYVNGIAIGVIELKRSRVSIGDGIRQNLSNQQPEFNAWFFATNQLVLAGNDSEGLRYGAIQTPEKYFLSWKEDEADNSQLKLDKYLLKICRKDRLIELLRDFVLFDGGIKKLPRVHQFFGIKAAQTFVQQRRGGIAGARARDGVHADNVEQLRTVETHGEVQRHQRDDRGDFGRRDDLNRFRLLLFRGHVLDHDLFQVLELARHRGIDVGELPAGHQHIGAHLAHEAVLREHERVGARGDVGNGE